MSFRPVLNSADAGQLHGLCLSEAIPPSLRELLMEFLSRVMIADYEDGADLVAMGDMVTLASRDGNLPGMLLSVVLPEQRDALKGRLSVFSEISLAVIGRRLGDEVAWPEPPVFREMVIVSVVKADRGPELVL